jgi:hypothetical protein
MFAQEADGFLERRWVGQKRRDIFEDNPWLGEIGNISDVAGKVHNLFLFLLPKIHHKDTKNTKKRQKELQ